MKFIQKTNSKKSMPAKAAFPLIVQWKQIYMVSCSKFNMMLKCQSMGECLTSETSAWSALSRNNLYLIMIVVGLIGCGIVYSFRKKEVKKSVIYVGPYASVLDSAVLDN